MPETVQDHLAECKIRLNSRPFAGVNAHSG
jgi:hypothetical protein